MSRERTKTAVDRIKPVLLNEARHIPPSEGYNLGDYLSNSLSLYKKIGAALSNESNNIVRNYAFERRLSEKFSNYLTPGALNDLWEKGASSAHVRILEAFLLNGSIFGAIRTKSELNYLVALCKRAGYSSPINSPSLPQHQEQVITAYQEKMQEILDKKLAKLPYNTFMAGGGSFLLSFVIMGFVETNISVFIELIASLGPGVFVALLVAAVSYDIYRQYEADMPTYSQGMRGLMAAANVVLNKRLAVGVDSSQGAELGDPVNNNGPTPPRTDDSVSATAATAANNEQQQASLKSEQRTSVDLGRGMFGEQDSRRAAGAQAELVSGSAQDNSQNAGASPGAPSFDNVEFGSQGVVSNTDHSVNSGPGTPGKV
ncbi:MAG: hypothetical protein K0Q74_1602 [Gammaproteobacteria bacterium]|jgi:hypothetical protein|nr:hypothetical protein [Gammaproteobacteria bacterium]